MQKVRDICVCVAVARVSVWRVAVSLGGFIIENLGETGCLPVLRCAKAEEGCGGDVGGGEGGYEGS